MGLITSKTHVCERVYTNNALSHYLGTSCLNDMRTGGTLCIRSTCPETSSSVKYGSVCFSVMAPGLCKDILCHV